MASLTHVITDETTHEHMNIGIKEFTRLEKMLLFAVISECDRCIVSEGYDCFDAGKTISCPFVSIREEYNVVDLPEWKELIG
jgi:hypothetical protein